MGDNCVGIYRVYKFLCGYALQDGVWKNKNVFMMS